MKGFEERVGEEIEDIEPDDYENHFQLVKDVRSRLAEKEGYRLVRFEVYSDVSRSTASALGGEYTVGEIHGVLEDTREGFSLKVRKNPANPFRVGDSQEYSFGIEPAEYVDEVVSDLPDVMNPQFL